MTRRYNFDRQYGDLFQRNGVDLGELLRLSNLPEDLFSRRDIVLTQVEYFKLMEQLGELAKRDSEVTIIQIGTAENLETIIPPMFAAYCSSDGLSFLKRFSTYKRLIGPMHVLVIEKEDTVVVELTAEGGEIPLPNFFAEVEILFILATIRKATQQPIVPLEVSVPHEATNSKIKEYLACPIVKSTDCTLTFSLADMKIPFKSRNDTMLAYFEPELNRRLSEMELDDSMAARVRSVIIELLPAGRTSLEDVANRLHMSRRTLQRKLSEENTTFQQQLNSTRLLLAQNYLKRDNHTSEDIAFLLGYEDVNSFLRAFNLWTGKTIMEYRKERQM